VADYRAYQLDKFGHIFSPPTLVTANSDEAAIEAARRLINGHDVELWESTRRITQLKAGR
jgi:hypothetical protein